MTPDHASLRGIWWFLSRKVDSPESHLKETPKKVCCYQGVFSSHTDRLHKQNRLSVVCITRS